MNFPHPLIPDLETRAGRMLSAGRVKVTVTSEKSGQHVTILFKAFADNRKREYDPRQNKNWVSCPLTDATHVFVEVPNAGDQWNDKVGTYYPLTGRWYDADNADPNRVWAAQAAAHWVMHPSNPPKNARFQEESECGVCGRTLTDPGSIDRGIGPECFGNLTGSQHQVKTPSQLPPPEQVIMQDVLHAESERQESFADQNLADLLHRRVGIDITTYSNEDLAIILAAASEETQIRAARLAKESMAAEREHATGTEQVALSSASASDLAFLAR